MGWQLQDLGLARTDNDPLSAASLPLLSRGSGNGSPAVTPEKGGNILQCLDVCLTAGTMLESDLSPSQK